MSPPSIHLFYATHDGQTLKIVARLKERLEALGLRAFLTNVAEKETTGGDLCCAKTVVIVAPIRFGFHLSPVDHFIRRHIAFLRANPPVLVSVNLTARKTGKDTPANNPYYRKWIRRHRLQPVFGEVLAGRLDYPLYKTWEKWVIRLIMMITGGPTNLNTAVDYTDWSKVDSLANRIAAHNKEREAA